MDDHIIRSALQRKNFQNIGKNRWLNDENIRRDFLRHVGNETKKDKITEDDNQKMKPQYA